MRSIRVLLPAVLALVAATADARKLPKPKRGFQMSVRPFSVAVNEDLEVCDYRRLPNATEMDVSGFELLMPKGAHHFVIWSYSGATEDDAAFPRKPVASVGCSGLMPDELVPSVLIPIQSPNSRFRFPPGVALKLGARQQVWLNPHMKNLGKRKIKPKVKFNFIEAEPGSVQHYAEGVILGNMSGIAVPAGGRQMLTTEFTASYPMNFIYVTPHQHQLGTHARIDVVRANGSEENLLESTDWEHPNEYKVEPPEKPVKRLEAGDKLRLYCTWENSGPTPVRFGPETTHEMCFILGYYYRDPGDAAPRPGFDRGCIPAKRGLLCPFAPAVASESGPLVER